jgi:acyl dehydratase
LGHATPSATHDLSSLLVETRRQLGAPPKDVQPGVSLADWLRISRVVAATGDQNPLYLDPNYGARSWWRTMVAPPVFVLAAQVPESSGALDLQPYPAVDLLNRIELWWDDHIRLGQRVASTLQIVGVQLGPTWRERDTVEVISRAEFRTGETHLASATGVVRVHPLALGSELFVERAVHSYDVTDIGSLEEALEADPGPRGTYPRFAEDVTIGDILPNVTRGPFTWSDLVTWIIAEGRAVAAGNLRYKGYVPEPGSPCINPVTGWPMSERRSAREDLFACRNAGFPAPCARPALVVALGTQVVTNWMGDDAFLRHFSCSLQEPVLYGDTIRFSASVIDKCEQQIGKSDYVGAWLEVNARNQLNETVLAASALVFLPTRSHPVELPVTNAPDE